MHVSQNSDQVRFNENSVLKHAVPFSLLASSTFSRINISPSYVHKRQDGIKHRMKDDEDRANLLCCPQAQTLPQSSLQSAQLSKYLCADTLAWWNHRVHCWFLHQRSCQFAFVVYSKTTLAFIFYFLWPAGQFTFKKSHTRLAAVMSFAEPEPPSLLVSNMCMYMRDFLHAPNFATFWQESYRRPPECSCQCPRMTWSKPLSALHHSQTFSSGNTFK
jgi:hypothetical protein